MTGSARIGGVALGARPRIVAAGGEAEVEALAHADGAHVVELRADLFDEPTPARIVAALERVRAGGRPVVLTVRAPAEGGRGGLPDERRRALYDAGLALADAIDVEIASTAIVAPLARAVRRAGKTLILSTHDFESTPPRTELLARVARALDAGADVAKIATRAHALADLQILIDVTRGVAPTPLATLAMGPLGPLSRVVLPAAGSCLTYAAAGAPTAPGQLPLAELARLVAEWFPA